MSEKLYHYIIISSFDPTDIPLDRRDNPDAVPVNWEQAEIQGQAALKALSLNPDQYYVKIVLFIDPVHREEEKVETITTVENLQSSNRRIAEIIAKHEDTTGFELEWDPQVNRSRSWIKPKIKPIF